MLLLALALAAPRAPLAAPIRAEILSARPTQMAIGFAARDARVERMSGESADAYMRARPAPWVEGPGGIYVTDRQHLLAAAHEKGWTHFYLEEKPEHVSKKTDPEEFWEELVALKLARPFDGAGVRRPFSQFPADVRGFEDDPYRSVAGFVRDRGGFRKSRKRFAEFDWADFFRRKLESDPRRRMKRAIEEALELARSKKARGLPGYKGR